MGQGINRNMRCIEIANMIRKNQTPHQINRNMRCIEIAYVIGVAALVPRD